MCVCLVLVGTLGDLSFRKFLKDAKALASSRTDLDVFLVDRGWQNNSVSRQTELSYRIVRREIELHAERLSGLPGTSAQRISELASTQLPWTSQDYVNQLHGGDLKIQRELDDKLDEWLTWMTLPTRCGIDRYWDDASALVLALQNLPDRLKTVVFAATPPGAYPSIIAQWGSTADRIVLEKPACGLDANLNYTGNAALLNAISAASPQCQIVTSDHYNAKLVTRAMDRLKDYHLLDYLLDPSRLQRIIVQIVEPAPLPLGRYKFYNGAGGTFGDMTSHLLQAARALLGLTTGQLCAALSFIGPFEWARYDAPSVALPTALPYSYDPDYYENLDPRTETFVAFKAILTLAGRQVDLFCRTGKGVEPAHKSLRADCLYSGSKAVSLIFDFSTGEMQILDETPREEFIMQTGKLSITDVTRSGVPRIGNAAEEYRGIFECLVEGPWTPNALDTRYFPSISDAVALADKVFTELCKRRAQHRTMNTYIVGDAETNAQILNLLTNSNVRW